MEESIRSINDTQDSIIEAFNEMEDWMDKYQLLIDMGGSLASIEEQYKQPQFLIEGCQSRVWLHTSFVDGKILLEAESDAVIVKGIVYLLIQVLSERTPQEILDADLYFIDKIGLKDHLSPTRANGLISMVRQIRNYALVYKLKEN